MDEAGEQLIEDLMRLRPEELTANGWAVKAGVSRTIWADIRRHGNPSRRTLEKLLAAVDSNLAEFEALRVGPAASRGVAAAVPRLGDMNRDWRQAPIAPLPVVDTRPGGEWGESGSGIELLRIVPDRIVGHVARPHSLATDAGAFAITVIGDSMWPRFRPGRRLAVSTSAPVGIGDDVLVLVGSPAGGLQDGLAKELVARSASELQLRQYRPDRVFEVPQGRIEAVHKVLGELF